MSDLSDYLWRLSKRYGPLMSIRLGMVQTLVVSSAEMAKEVMKTNDLNFCTRPVLTGLKKISYDNKDLAFSPYNMFPFMGWLDKLNGSIARLEKIVKDMDEFYQQLIDEHLDPDRPNIIYANRGTDTSVATVVWAMVLLIKNPKSLKKVQQEVRNVIGNKGKVNEDDLDKLKYLKAVIVGKPAYFY
ncbi:cytochrome P450 [Tanacetum coccineum]